MPNACFEATAERTPDLNVQLFKHKLKHLWRANNEIN